MTFNAFELESMDAVQNALDVLSEGGVGLEPIHEPPWSKGCAPLWIGMACAGGLKFDRQNPGSQNPSRAALFSRGLFFLRMKKHPAIERPGAGTLGARRRRTLKRKGILLVISMMCMALFTGCASNADMMPETSPTAGPTASAAPSVMPTDTAGPTVSLSPTNTAAAGMQEAGVNSVEDAQRVSDQVSEEVEKLSELDKAEAVVAGGIALVGISYDTQYQGGLTERVNQMVTERVEMIDKAITTVHVTDDEQAVTRIAQLREKLRAGDITFEELQTQVLDIGSGITGGGSPQVSQPQSDTGA